MNQSKAVCQLCGEPMPEGEDMFKYHGYSGTCPKPPKPKEVSKVEPSQKAIEAAEKAYEYAWSPKVDVGHTLAYALKAAYAIDLAALKKELGDCTKSRQKQNANVERLEEENERLQQQLSDAQAEIDGILEDRATAEADLAEENDKYNAAQAECERLKEDVVKSLEEMQRIPTIPFPDPGAHSWRAFGERAFTAYSDLRRLSSAILSRLKGGG